MSTKMSRLPTVLLSCVLFIIDLVTATSFTNPVGADFGTTYNLGQQITISWQGAENFTALSLGLRQSSTQQIYWIIGSPGASPSGYTQSSYLWSIALGNGESLSLGNEFSFWLIDGGYDTQIYSPQFYLQDPSASSTTTKASSSSTAQPSASTINSQSTSTSTSSAASSTETTTKPTNSASAVVDNESSFSTGAKVGVAVGVVAAFALGIGLAYFLFRRRERAKVADPVAQHVPIYDPNHEGKVYGPVNTDPYSYYGQQELPGNQLPAELQHHSQVAHEVP